MRTLCQILWSIHLYRFCTASKKAIKLNGKKKVDLAIHEFSVLGEFVCLGRESPQTCVNPLDARTTHRFSGVCTVRNFHVSQTYLISISRPLLSCAESIKVTKSERNAVEKCLCVCVQSCTVQSQHMAPTSK